MQVTEDQIKYMVDRFLGWRLPDNFNPDCGISYTERLPSSTRPHPTGTNLLDAQQATAMVRYLIDGILDEPQPSAVISVADWERVFKDACDEAGCEYDNEALLSSIANLTSYADMLWAWFTERRGAEDMRANVADGGLSAEDFRQMLNDHEANLLPDVPQTAEVTDAMIEASAQAISLWDGCDWDGVLGSRECSRNRYRAMARAALSLSAPSPARPQ